MNRKQQDIMPDTGAAWRYAKIDGRYYYDYDRIPNADEKFGGKEMLVQAYEQGCAEATTNSLRTHIAAAVARWNDYLADYAGHTAQQAERLAQAAAVIQAAVEYIVQHDIDVRRFSFFADLSLCCKGVPYLPANVRRLKEKVLRVLAGETVTEVVVLPRMGNNNAAKWDDPQVIAWITVMRSAGVNYSNAHIARAIATTCAINDKVPPSKSWTEHYLARPDVKQLTYTRYGKGGRRAMGYQGYIPMEGAVFAGDCWLMDATRVNFIEFSQNGNDWAHLMVCMVYDVHSGAVLARTYALAENRWMYAQALAAAATAVGYLPYEVVTDRFPGHNTPEWEATVNKLQRDGVKVTMSYKMTGKARLERAIDTVQMVAMQQSDKYYGQGIQSRRDYAHRSEEALAAMRKRARAEGWNMETAIAEAEKAFEAYNNMPYSQYSRARKSVTQSPIELHNASDKPHVHKAQPYELLHYFGLSKTLKVSRQGMLTTEIMGAKYTYVIDPAHYHTVKKHAQVTMYYDLENLNTVQLYSVAKNPADEVFICEATEQKAVRWTGPSRDTQAMGKARSRIQRWTALQEEEMAAHVAAAGFSSDLQLVGATSNKAQRETAETEAMLQRTIASAPAAAPKKNRRDDDVINIDIRDLY